MPELADTVRARTRGWIDLVANIISRAQQDGDLPSGLDATALRCPDFHARLLIDADTPPRLA